MKEMWIRHEFQRTILCQSTVNLTLSLHGRVMGSAHYLTEVNILSKFNENQTLDIQL